MKMKNMIATLSAIAVSATCFAAMSFSASAAEEIGQAYMIGSFGTESNWNPGENANVSVVPVTGNGQYEVTWTLAEATNTGDSNFFISVVVAPKNVDNFCLCTYPELSASLDEVWVDGVQLSGYDASTSLDANYHENGAGTTRLYLRGDWANNSTQIIGNNLDITTDIKVKFTVSGLPEAAPEETQAPTEAPTDAPADTTAAPADTTAAAGGTTAAATTAAAKATTAAATTNANTADTTGIALVLAGLTAAGAVALVSKKNK